MATSNVRMWTVNVPDHAPVKLPHSLTVDEVRATLEQQGHPAVGTAQATVNGDTITFARPTGGVKGL